MQLLKKVQREFSYNLGLGYPPLPEAVTIEVNYDCMFRCQMCRMWTKDFKISRIRDNEILSKSELEKVIRELSSMGVKFIHFGGGEPFLRSEFLEIVKLCKSKRLYCSTFSNGFLIDDDLAQNIVRSKMDSMGVSIDGASSELHDNIRGVKGAFEHAIKGIRLIKRQQKDTRSESPEIFIHCTVSSENLLSLPGMIDLAKSLDVGRIKFQYLSVVGKDTVELTNRMMGEKVIDLHTFADISPTFLLKKEQIEKLDFVIESIKERAGSNVKCELDPVFLNGKKDLLEKGVFPVLKCQIPWRSAIITPVGDVVPCSMLTEYNMGSLRHITFEEIWNGERARNIRRHLSKRLPPICQKCCVVHRSEPQLWKRLYYKFRRGLLKKPNCQEKYY